MRKIQRGTFEAVIRAYLESEDFRRLAPATKSAYQRFLYRVAQPDMLGTVGVGMLRPSVMQAYLDGLASRPGIAQKTRAALRTVESWAIVRELLPHPIMLGTSTPKLKGGRKPWSDEQVAIAEANARHDLARVITLMANTGQRGSDVVKMRWSDLSVYRGQLGINVRQQKTGRELWVPCTAELARAIDTWERRPGFISLQNNGLPWISRNNLSVYWAYELRHNEALAPLRAAGCVLHGLRATAVVRLRRSGANAQQIADTVGMSIPMVERYCRFADQKDNAIAAIHYLDRTRTEQTRLKVRDSSGTSD